MRHAWFQRSSLQTATSMYLCLVKDDGSSGDRNMVVICWLSQLVAKPYYYFIAPDKVR